MQMIIRHLTHLCKDPDSISDSICLVVSLSQQLALRLRRSAMSGYCLSDVRTAYDGIMGLYYVLGWIHFGKMIFFGKI